MTKIQSVFGHLLCGLHIGALTCALFSSAVNAQMACQLDDVRAAMKDKESSGSEPVKALITTSRSTLADAEYLLRIGNQLKELGGSEDAKSAAIRIEPKDRRKISEDEARVLAEAILAHFDLAGWRVMKEETPLHSVSYGGPPSRTA